ncbi:uncharacterized protein LOC6523903 [Drosophila yakuba]|uniref:Uncharacterized protein, isoform A n=1 Tax=Drosophila yakuba TaxID=7245 RepID=B4PXN1_DROYA|nr:uncharacterized protein LOC6523903 [Drosophila yakuba]EDX00884.1 uncharacterized protein Dyak_GE16677, isoform A [Drosophila yakuba]
MLIWHLLLWPTLIASAPPRPLTDQKAEVAKLRAELEKALEHDNGAPPGVVVAPTWTQQASQPPPGKGSKVVVDHSSLSSASAIRQEIQQAVAHQGQNQEVLQLEALLKARGSSKESPAQVSKSRKEQLLGATVQEANVVESHSTSQIVDLEQLQRLELSKRRTRDMLILGRIEEFLNYSMPTDVDRWLTLQANGSVYLVGQQREGLLVLSEDFTPLQPYGHPFPMTAILGMDRWNRRLRMQEGLLVMASQDQLIWLRLEPSLGLTPIWHWSIGSNVTEIRAFNLEGQDYLALVANHTLNVYVYDLEAEEFWIAQRVQMAEAISNLAVLDAGRELLLAVGQWDEVLIYACSSKGQPLHLRQQISAPEVAGVTAFQMGGRSYLALGGILPQILVYVQGQLVPRTILGQNFGFVDHYLPIPVRSYRDDLLLLVQHRVAFDTHSLLVLEVLVWNGEAFEAGLPPPCGTSYGAGCMLDQDREAGISGAVLVRRLNQPPLVLVPRKEAPTGIFRLETQLLARNSEAQDLLEIRQFMQDWVHEQETLIQLAEQLLMEDKPESHHHEELSTPLVVSEGGTVEELFVNGARWTGADAVVDINSLLQQILVLDRELGSRRSKRQPETLFNFHYEQLEVEDIEAAELILEQLNHATFYIKNGSLDLPLGTLNVEQLELLEAPKVELVPVQSAESHESLKLTTDLDCIFINEMEWDKLLQDLVWRHQPLKLSQLHVEGPVIFEDVLNLHSLNDLSFPGDYLWSQGNETSVVQAPKEFTQTLSANAVDTSGTINAVYPQDVITLSDSQEWPGLVTFSHLEVSEELELNGSAQGRQFEEAPLNPTLLESRVISADCHFEQLLVRGPVRLLQKVDNDSFDSLLGDLVQLSPNSDQELQIRGPKSVDQLLLPVDAHVADDQLSGISLNDFVTKHTPQTLSNLTQLGGYVYFHRLELGKESSYDGVHLEELLSKSVRLDGPIPLSFPHTRLRFVGHAPNFSRLQVDSTLNEVPLSSGYQLVHEPLHLARANFSRLEAGQAQVNHDVSGSGLLNGRNLSNVLQEQPRTWSGEVHVQELILPQGVQANQLQGIKAELLLDFLQQLDELPLLILQGRIQVERIAVNGSVHVAETLNMRAFHELQRQVVWLDRQNELRTRWTLKESPQFQQNLQVLGSFNERLLPELLNDIVPRSDGHEVLIEGTKSFLAPVYIEELQLAALNGIPFKHVANKLNPLHLTGNVRIQGRIFVEELQLNGQINGDLDFPADLERLLRWDTSARGFVHRGVVELPKKELQSLVVLGHLKNGSREPVQELFDQLIFKQQRGIHLHGHKTFTGRLRIEDGAHITRFNGLNLGQLLENLIYIDSQGETLLETPVRFAADVKMDHLEADRLVLSGELLNGCNVSQWLRDTIRVDRDLQEPKVAFARGSLDGNFLEAEELNQVNLSLVVTRFTEQHLSDPLEADDLLLDGQLMVRGNVNGQNLSQEYANTLMINPSGEQQVDTPLLLSSITVSESLEVTAPVNGLNLSDVAILGEDPLRLQSPLYFDTLHAPFLRAHQNLNGFDFKDWYEGSLWARGREQQEISGNWRVKKLQVKQGDELRPRRQTAEESYREFCEGLARMLLPYKVQKLQKRFELNQEKDQENIRRVFDLEAPGGIIYLLVNQQGCWTRIHRWNGSLFDRSGAFKSGPVDEAVALRVGNTSSNQEFAFMTSYELQDDQTEPRWNCSEGKPILLSWKLNKTKTTEHMELSADTLRNIKEQYEQRKSQPLPNPSYQQAIKYLQRPTIKSLLGSKWQEAKQELSPSEMARMRRRLLDTLEFRLQTEVNITQLSIPESDLFDEHLVEDFLELMRQLRSLRRRLDTETLPLPNTPARVLAARSAQLIWPTLQELREVSALDGNASGFQEQVLEQTLLDVLTLANEENGLGDDEKLHAVIQRLRNLKAELHGQEDDHEGPAASSSDRKEQFLPLPAVDWRPVQTLRLAVGPANRPRLLYARLTVVTPRDEPPPTTPSTAPAAHIQLHHANGSLFQSLAGEHGARHLTSLRVRDETLLAFVEGCCRIRVLIYRGVQGFVDFARFRAAGKELKNGDGEVLQLLSLRLPLSRQPGAMYFLAVVQARRVTFYEVVVAGLLEPWLKCS